MTIMYGIANCDTIKKAKKLLTEHDISFEFHDYKKLGANADVLQQAITAAGLDTVVNKRGTTYRKLSDEQKNALNNDTAIALLLEHSSMIKRPILVHNNSILVGFNAQQYKECFNLA